MTPVSFAEGSLPKSLPHSSHSSRLKLIAHAEEKLNPLTSLPKRGNINRKGFSPALAARLGIGLRSAPVALTAPPSPPGLRWLTQAARLQQPQRYPSPLPGTQVRSLP